MTAARADRGFIAELDGLRGIAILLVMVHRFWPRSDSGLAADVAGAGWIGVDLFFVISGFLITGILLETRGRPDYFRNFYIRRILRIFPLYYLFVGTVLLVFSWNPAFREGAGSPLWYLFYLGNMPEGVLGNDVPYWLGPVWSLAIEEQFYLTFPWLVALLDRRRLTIVLLSIMAITPVVRTVTMLIAPEQERVQYLFTLCRLDTIAIGCLLAIVWRSIDIERHHAWLRKAGIVVLASAAIIALLTGLDRTTGFGRIAGYSVVALGCGAIVMLTMLAVGQRSSAPLRAAWLRYFGKLCFGLYLLHRPADTIVSALAGRAGLDGAALWLIPLKVIAAVAMATLSWRLLEQPILGLKSAFGGVRHPGHGGKKGTRVSAVHALRTTTTVLVLLLVACKAPTPIERVTDGGTNAPDSIDASSEPVDADASTQPHADASTQPDAVALLDAGIAVDAAVPPDASVVADAAVPIDAGPPPPPPPPPPTLNTTAVLYTEGSRHSPVTPAIVAHWQAIAARAQQSDNVFAKVGDSITAAPDFMRCFDGTTVNLGASQHLASTIAYFRTGNAAGATPFGRNSVAAVGGTMASNVLAGSPSALEREVTAIDPRVALVMFGTNEVRFGRSAQEMAENLWTVIDQLITRGIVPVMSTIPPMNGNPEADGHIPLFNRFIRAIAQGRGVPLVDFYRDMAMLPNRGLSADGIHPSTYSAGACQLTSAGLAYGYNLRNLVEVEALDRVRAALTGTAADSSAPTRAGNGTSTQPFVSGLPVLDVGDTRGGETRLAIYPCTPRVQLGEERVYRIDLSSQTTLDAYIVDRGGVDADVHILVGTDAAQSCVAWGDDGASAIVGPGPAFIVIDSSGPSTGGEYALVVNAR